jgi:hypothetical protein
MEIQPSNSQSRELRVVLVLSPSRQLCMEGANKEEPYPIASRVSEVGERGVEGHRLTNSRDREVAKSAFGCRSWS